MSNVFFIDNVLPVDLILQIKNYVNKEQPDHTNHNRWNQEIVKDSARVDVFPLNHTPFYKNIIIRHTWLISSTCSRRTKYY